jgi:hypothetical protein
MRRACHGDAASSTSSAGAWTIARPSRASRGRVCSSQDLLPRSLPTELTNSKDFGTLCVDSTDPFAKTSFPTMTDGKEWGTRCRVPTGCSGRPCISVAAEVGAGRILENLKSSPMCYSIERRDHCVAVFRVVHCSLAEIHITGVACRVCRFN